MKQVDSVQVIQTREIWTKLLRAAAVLAMLTGTLAVAQVTFQVGGPIDRSVHAEVQTSAASGAAAGGRAQSHASSASWAPVQTGPVATSSTFKVAGGKHDAEGPGQSPFDQGAAKQEKTKKAGIGMGAGGAGASSFGATKGKNSDFGYTGKMGAVGGYSANQQQKAEEARFAKATRAHGTSGGGHRKHGRGKSFMPKLEPKGEQQCNQGSSLQLCTWL
jgi:hypothetical protein